MKPIHARRTTGGFSGWDLLAVLVLVFLAIGLLLPASTGGKAKAGRISCVNGIKQIGLAYRMWANDNSSQLPWMVESSPSNSGTLSSGGTLSYAASTNAWRHFQIISNEVNTPKVLVCPDDRSRTKVATWDVFANNNHLSYFVGLDASEVLPQTVLSGDRNLANSDRMLSGVVALPEKSHLSWTKAIHKKVGNIGLGDGSVQQLNNAAQLDRQFQAAFLAKTSSVYRLSFPQ